MNITFGINHKYVAVLLENQMREYLPGAAGSTLKVEVESNIEYLADKIVAHWKELRREILVDQYEVTYFEPSSAWQYWKHQHAPEWFKGHFPVINTEHTKTVKFTRFAEYPMADIKIPDHFGPVVIHDIVDEATEWLV